MTEEPAVVESHAKRTLMKSAPELWELADDPTRLGVWMAMLADRRDPVAVEVVDREENSRIAWTAGEGDAHRLELTFTESGFGTVVEARAEHLAPTDHATLETIIDDLGSVERRPYSAA